MPAPSKFPDWAHNPSSPDQLVEPSPTTLAEGWKPSQRPPAQFFNWWMNLAGRWIRWLDSEAKRIEARFNPMNDRVVTIPLSAFFFNPSEVAPNPILNPYWRMRNSFTRLFVPLSPFLPDGAVITKYEVIVKPGEARSEDNRIRLIAFDQVFDFSTPASPILSVPPADSLVAGPVTDNGTTDLQVLTLKSGSPNWSAAPIDKTNRVRTLQIEPGVDSGAKLEDFVFGVRLTYNDKGLRF